MNESCQAVDPRPGPDADGGRRGRDRIPGYRIVALISQGGMGRVYRAVQRSLDRPVALKILQPRLSADSEFVARFKREAHLGATLSHPNLIRVYEAGEADGLLYYSMELSQSCDLSVMLGLVGRLPADLAACIALKVTSALEAVHAISMLHQDVKPDNVLLTQSGGVKLVDLGLASPTGQPAGERKLWGTPNYMSPEQLTGQGESTERTDLYMLGATLLHLVSGEVPFGEGRPERVFARVLHGAPELPVDLEPGLSAIILRCMHRDPRARYPSASALSAALRRHLVAKACPGRRLTDGWLTSAGAWVDCQRPPRSRKSSGVTVAVRRLERQRG